MREGDTKVTVSERQLRQFVKDAQAWEKFTKRQTEEISRLNNKLFCLETEVSMYRNKEVYEHIDLYS